MTIIRNHIAQRLRDLGKRGYAEALWGRALAQRWAAARGIGDDSVLPEVRLENAVLQTSDEAQRARRVLRRARLPTHWTPEKDWDTLAALSAVRRHVEPSEAVLDAGGALYSTLLPSLAILGYEQLFGLNLEFNGDMRRGPARLAKGDLTSTSFPDDFFSAVTCLSVIEHGVPLDSYFAEMARIMRPGGVLITSTDYWHEPLDTQGLSAYGQPVKVFAPHDVARLQREARSRGFQPTSDVELECDERVVHWERAGLDYTFLLLVHRLT